MASQGLTFNIFGHDVSASSALKKVEGEAANTSSKISGHFKKIGGAIAGAFAVGGVTSFLSGAIGEAAEAQKVGAQTAAVLKSTGNAAGVTAGQIGNLAGAISAKAGIDDEAIQSGENLLLTFTNIRNEAGKGNDVFDQATQAMTDLSVATGTDMKAASIQVGKALNDPIKGITALSRVGVSFTEQQKEQIKTMVETGDTMGAQKMILGELNKEFGGSAEAQATPAMKAKVAWGNLQEQIGTGLMPVITKLSDVLTKYVVPAISAVVSWVGRNKEMLKTLALVLAPLVAAWGAWTLATKAQAVATGIATGAQTLFNAVMDANPITLVVVAIAALAAGFVVAWKKSETFRNVVKGVLDTIKKAAQFLWGVLKKIFEVWKAEWRIVAAVFKAVWNDGIKPVWNAMKATASFVWNQVLKRIFTVWKAEWRGLSAVFKAVWNYGIKPVIGAVGSVWQTTWNVVKGVFGKIKDGIRVVRDVIKSVAGVFKSVLSPIVHAFQWVWDKVRAIVGKIEDAIGAVADEITNTLGDISGFLGLGSVHTGGGGKVVGSLPANAQGTGFFRGGMSVVGEHGPELVSLPRGSRITSHTAAMSQMRGGGSTVVNIHVSMNGIATKAEVGRAVASALEAAAMSGTKAKIGRMVVT